MSESLVASLRGVAVKFGHVPVLHDVDLEVEAGEAVGLVGPNGSGKSTLLRVIATLTRPTGGEGMVLGADVKTTQILKVRRRIALIGHQPALYPELTLKENLVFVAKLGGVSIDGVDRTLEMVGLGAAKHRRADQSSHGMQRRVEFARVIMSRPDLLLLDEAHAGLDRFAASLVEAVVADVRRRGGAAVLVSHELDRMLPIVQRTYELVGGTLVVGDHRL
jgi:heme ABC exporter ATP-binding subunit CcmA